MSEIRVLFVCLGNICRSPLAEAAFRKVSKAAGRAIREINSAGTGNWHDGEMPDPRAIEVGARHGAPIHDLRARQVKAEDFENFTHIIALDTSNLRDLKAIAPSSALDRISLLMDHVPGREGTDVADPYFSDAKAFETCWADVLAGAKELLKAIGN